MPFYAVRVGKKPGIYTSWDECKKQVIGVKGSIYKKFNSKSSAEEFYKNKSKYYKKTPKTKTQTLIKNRSLKSEIRLPVVILLRMELLLMLVS